jgi:hypothetical protein
MKKLIVLTGFLFLNVPGLLSQDLINDNFTIAHGPWIQNLSPTGLTLMWTTNKPAVPGVTITAPDGTARFIRNSTDGIVNGGGTLHKVRIDGL